MEDKICLDTDFLVNFLRNSKEEAEFIQNNEIDKDLAATYISIFELYYGAYKSNEREKNLKAIESLLNRVTLLGFSIESAKKAGEILAKLEKEGNLIEFRDLFIGAIVLVHNYSLKTGNRKHFEKIHGLKVLE